MLHQELKYRILIPVFSFGKQGGIRVLSQLANYWVNIGHSVTVISYFENDKPYYPIKAPILWLDNKGVEVEENQEKYDASNSGLKRSFSIMKFLGKHSKEYDVVVANHNFSVWAVLFGSKSNNYYYIQAFEPEFYSINSIKGLAHKGLAWLTYFLPLTRVVNADIYKKYKNLRAQYVIPPGLDLNNYYPKPLSCNNKPLLVVGCIGRTEEWKGPEDVSEAVRILHSKGYQDKIKLKVAFNPVSYEKHELVQPHGDENLANYYRSLDVLVAPGHIQLGAVHYPVIEAMACNVPVITTGYYPADETNSFIVPVKRTDKIAEVLENIYMNYSIAYEKATVAQKQMQEFSWERVAQKFIDIFEDNIRAKEASK